MKLRDAVHGFIELTWEERKLLDLPVMQRLRRIKQLALASLVYPGATHTRFEHSLGVFHIASQMAARLATGEDEEYVDVIRFAALLHDIGHGPFSHVSEFALSQFADRDKLGVDEGQQVHEHLGWRIIETDHGISQVLSAPVIDRVVSVLKGQGGWEYIKGIISGPLDADKQDYLLRDSQFCGVKYGIYDLPRLLQSLQVAEDAGQKYLAVAEDSIHAAEQYVLAKYYLTTQVYCHRIRLISDEMLKRAILLGVEEDGIGFLKELYQSPELSDEYIENYLRWTDDRVARELLAQEYSTTLAGELLSSLHKRELWKRVFDVPLNEESFPEPEVRSLLSGKPDRETKRTIECCVADELGIDQPAFVALNVFSIKSVRADLEGQDAPLLVKTSAGEVKYFEDVSWLFASISKSATDERVEVYAPIAWPDDPAQKSSKQQELRERVRAVIRKALKTIAEKREEADVDENEAT